MCLRIGLVFFRAVNCSSSCQRLLRHNASVSGALLKFRGHADRRVQRSFINGKLESWEIPISHSKCRSPGSGGGYWRGAQDAALTSNHPLCWAAAANLSIYQSVHRTSVLDSSGEGEIIVGRLIRLVGMSGIDFFLFVVNKVSSVIGFFVGKYAVCNINFACV